MEERINRVKKISRNKANRQRCDGGGRFGGDEEPAADRPDWTAGKLRQQRGLPDYESLPLEIIVCVCVCV